jgi:uncharacterized membrane protein YfcA
LADIEGQEAIHQLIMPVSASYSRRLQLIAVTTLASGFVAATFMPKIRADNAGTATVSEHFVRRLSTSGGTLIDEDEELPSLFPFSPQDYLGFGSAILGLLLAAGGGIGGGGILVPIYILLLEFPVKHAIPLASTTVLGGAIASNIWNARKRHPDHPERPLIDWDLILQLEPLTIAGALIGADLNKELPELVLLILMLLLLTVTAQKTLSKAIKLYRKEEEDGIKGQRQRQAEDTANENTSLIPVLRETPFDIENKESGLSTGADGKEWGDSVDDIKMMIAKQCLIDALKLSLLFAVVTVLDLLQGAPDGNGGGPLGLQSCGTTCYWVSEVMIFLLIVLFSLYARSSILKRQDEGGPKVSEIHWDSRNTITYPCFSIVAGLVAGMFGIGGGIIKGPLMLALGVHPQVASATSAAMILFTSCTATISYSSMGFLKYDYAFFCLVLGFLSTLVGKTFMAALLERSGQRSSYIAFCIGGVVAISAVAMGIESAFAMWG